MQLKAIKLVGLGPKTFELTNLSDVNILIGKASGKTTIISALKFLKSVFMEKPLALSKLVSLSQWGEIDKCAYFEITYWSEYLSEDVTYKIKFGLGYGPDFAIIYEELPLYNKQCYDIRPSILDEPRESFKECVNLIKSWQFYSYTRDVMMLRELSNLYLSLNHDQITQVLYALQTIWPTLDNIYHKYGDFGFGIYFKDTRFTGPMTMENLSDTQRHALVTLLMLYADENAVYFFDDFFPSLPIRNNLNGNQIFAACSQYSNLDNYKECNIITL